MKRKTKILWLILILLIFGMFLLNEYFKEVETTTTTIPGPTTTGTGPTTTMPGGTTTTAGPTTTGTGPTTTGTTPTTIPGPTTTGTGPTTTLPGPTTTSESPTTTGTTPTTIPGPTTTGTGPTTTLPGPTTTQPAGTTTTTSPTTTTPGSTTTIPPEVTYTGFMEAEAGQWVEYMYYDRGDTYSKTKRAVGEDTIDGKRASGFEIDVAIQDMETIVQMWIDSQENLIKYAMKIEGLVACMKLEDAEEEAPSLGGEKTPAEYIPNLPNISYGEYTTPTGKTVGVAIFTSGSGETWVSSEVPFGLIQVIDTRGRITMYLRDYGLSGATRQISKNALDNCYDLTDGMPGEPDIPT